MTMNGELGENEGDSGPDGLRKLRKLSVTRGQG
jgi:hypothetical protein